MTRTAWTKLWHQYRWLRRSCTCIEALAWSTKYIPEGRKPLSIACREVRP
jgi:hypothetical protein